MLTTDTELSIDLGQVLITQQAMVALAVEDLAAESLLERHRTCDWGEVDDLVTACNERALVDGGCFLSVYRLTGTDQPVYVLTEGDGLVTTVMLPEEYGPM